MVKSLEGTVSPSPPWGETESLNSGTRLIGTEFVTGPIWEVETRMTEHLFILQSVQSLYNSKGSGLRRPNPRSIDILLQIVRALPPSLNPVTFQPYKSQDLEVEDSGGVGREASFQPTPHFTP